MMSCELSEPHPPETLKCPRCDSLETKFCYYNNYSTAQPRHFCKNCKRYWTAGGSLRTVPVGGGLRKYKKSKLPKQMASPSSSADGTIDETSANSSASLLAYPTPVTFRCFDSARDSHYAGDYASSGMALPHFNYMDVRNSAHFYGGYGHTLPVEGLQQQKDAAYGGCKRRHGLDRDQSNSGEISEVACDPSQASSEAVKDPQPGLPAGLYQRYSDHYRYQEQGQQANGEEGMGWHQSFHDPDCPQGHGNSRSSAEQLLVSQNSQPRDRAVTEDEDEGLGNVVNVRYPYDWEQVSEVLFGGTPDFFQLPGF